MRPALALIVGLLCAAPASSQQDPFSDPKFQKDACSYLKDLFPDQHAGSCLPAFNRVNMENFRVAQNQSVDQFRFSVQSRAFQVTTVYENLLSDRSSAGIKDDSDIGKSGSAQSSVMLSGHELSMKNQALQQPINERTFAAWFPDDARLPQAFRQWVASVNSDIRLNNPYGDQRTRDAVLANNKVNLKKMEDVKDPATFRCRLLGECASGSVADPILVLTPQSQPGRDFQVGADNRPVRLAQAAPGGSLNRGTPTPTAQGTPKGGNVQVGGSGDGWVGAGMALLGVGMAAGAAWWSKKQEKSAWSDAEKEVAAQDAQIRSRQASSAANATTQTAPSDMRQEDGYRVKNGITLNDWERKVMADVLANADKKTPGAVGNYLSVKYGLRLRANGMDQEAPEMAALSSIQSRIASGDIVITPK